MIDIGLMIATVRQAKADSRELRQYELADYPQHPANTQRIRMINEDYEMQPDMKAINIPVVFAANTYYSVGLMICRSDNGLIRGEL